VRRAAALLLPALFLPALVAGCGHGRERPTAAVAPASPAGWRAVATDADRGKLRGWRDAWLAGLGRARAAGSGAAITAGGPLFDPDRALPDPLPPAGEYRCRLTRLGARGPSRAEYLSLAPMPCRVTERGEVDGFVRDDPRQRMAGRFYPDTASRGVFLGTLAFGDERQPPGYGRDPRRDLAGFVHRIGERRWRLLLPYPGFESIVDVMEIEPAG
jgi:hypothetical protein